jgi:hypothetical protein
LTIVGNPPTLTTLLRALTYRERVADVRCMSCSIDATLTAVCIRTRRLYGRQWLRSCCSRLWFRSNQI